jgi:hypothetical protein
MTTKEMKVMADLISKIKSKRDEKIIFDFCIHLAKTLNPRFNLKKFISYCKTMRGEE